MSVDKLPSFPLAAQEALSMVYDEDVDTKKITKSIRADPGLCSSVLQLANSSSYNAGKPTTNIQSAISRIGMKALTSILITHSMQSAFPFPNDVFLDSISFSKHAAFTGNIALGLGVLSKMKEPASLLLAGLFHDTGIAARALLEPDVLRKICRLSLDHGISIEAAEEKLKCQPHDELGAEALVNWNIPEDVRVVVQHHHRQNLSTAKELSLTGMKKIRIIQLADIVSHRFGASFAGYNRDTKVPPLLLTELGLTADQVQRVVKEARKFLTLYA